MKTKSKKSTETAAETAAKEVARKNRLMRRRLGLEIGDRVRVTDISSDLKDPNYDRKDAEYREMRTAELFRFCLGRVFTIYGFGRYGHVELEVSKSPAVRKKFGLNTIWIEPEFLKRVRKRKTRKKVRSSGAERMLRDEPSIHGVEGYLPFRRHSQGRDPSTPLPPAFAAVNSAQDDNGVLGT